MTTPVSKGLQCKDIPDELFLKAVENAAWMRDRPYAVMWDVQVWVTKDLWKLWRWSATFGEPENKDDVIPEKLVRNKARKLIRRGLMSGCYCGCRGEWRIVPNVVLSKAVSIDGRTKITVYQGGKQVGNAP